MLTASLDGLGVSCCERELREPCGEPSCQGADGEVTCPSEDDAASSGVPGESVELFASISSALRQRLDDDVSTGNIPTSCSTMTTAPS
jgi:hypothetical protein